MTRVCLVGKPDVDLRVDLLSYETARRALSTYSPEEPWANALCVETISLGAAVSLLNDLNWYLVRLVDDAFVLEPSVSGDEWLSRSLATDIRNERVEPAATGELLKIYGVAPPDDGDLGEVEDADPSTPASEAAEGGTADGNGSVVVGEDRRDGPGRDAATAGDGDEPGTASGGPPRLTDPMYAQRVTDETPEYDLEPVVDTVVVRVTAEEFGG